MNWNTSTSKSENTLHWSSCLAEFVTAPLIIGVFMLRSNEVKSIVQPLTDQMMTEQHEVNNNNKRNEVCWVI